LKSTVSRAARPLNFDFKAITRYVAVMPVTEFLHVNNVPPCSIYLLSMFAVQVLLRAWTCFICGIVQCSTNRQCCHYGVNQNKRPYEFCSECDCACLQGKTQCRQKNGQGEVVIFANFMCVLDEHSLFMFSLYHRIQYIACQCTNDWSGAKSPSHLPEHVSGRFTAQRRSNQICWIKTTLNIFAQTNFVTPALRSRIFWNVRSPPRSPDFLAAPLFSAHMHSCSAVKVLNFHSSFRLNSHFPGGPGLAVVYWSKGWWKWWWQFELQVVQSSSQIITTNKPTFYRPDALPVAQPTVSKHWRENITFHGPAYPKLTWGSSNFVSDHCTN